jgi:hypothetical protein
MRDAVAGVEEPRVRNSRFLLTQLRVENPAVRVHMHRRGEHVAATAALVGVKT